MQRIAGVDGCKNGWIVVESTLNLNGLKWKIAPQWNAIGPVAEVIAVDMPIGVSRDGVRQCEVEARNKLSPCGSRVFKTLPRGALRFHQEDWAVANLETRFSRCRVRQINRLVRFMSWQPARMAGATPTVRIQASSGP